jgi:hypothetical protein
MIWDRRTFLGLAGGALLPAFATGWSEVRDLVREGSLGRVVFCRVPPAGAGWLRFLLGSAIPVCERNDRDELVLYGTEATLVVNAAGYRRFS